jgi:hypothetical protein
MLYAILCYDSEEVSGAWTQEQDDAVIAKLMVVQKKLADEQRLGPVARLMPTSAATTVRKGKDAVVLDGPFAETKEQLLGFYVVECESLDAAIDVAKELGRAIRSNGSYEIRPLRTFRPGSLPSGSPPP